MHALAVLAGAAALAGGVVAATAGPRLGPSSSSAAVLAPIGAPGSWQLAFHDEFNGSRLDGSKWSTGWFGTGITQPLAPNALECFDPAAVSEGGGELDIRLAIHAETCGGRRRPFTAGIVTSNGLFSYTYGFVEARAWLPGIAGVVSDWPDIWTDGDNWPVTGENDIVEGLGGQACWHFHSTGGAHGRCAADSFTGGWHTFGADWEPGRVTYYYDGRVVGRIRHGITGAPMYLIMSIGADHRFGGPIRAARLRIDYIRVWRHP